MKLAVEDIMDLRHAAVNLVDDLTAKCLYISKTGQIGRIPEIYTRVQDLLEEIARITENQIHKQYGARVAAKTGEGKP